MDVLEENEALRLFFEGQDVSGVLESEVVDTSMLEQYLSNDLDPSTFILPESPPDSGSESCSPPQVPDGHYDNTCLATQAGTGPSCCLGDRGPGPPPSLTPQQRFLGLQNACISGTASPTTPGLHSPCHPQYLSPAPQNMQAHAPPTPPDLHHYQNLQCVDPANGYVQAHAPPTPPDLHRPAGGYIKARAPTAPPGLQQVTPGQLEPGYAYLCPAPSQQPGPMLPDTKKRRRSESFDGVADPRLWADPSRARGPFMPPECASAPGDIPNCDSDGQSGTAGQGAYQLLAWEAHQPNQWSTLYNSSYQSLSSPGYHVDTDKGFSYSSTDEAFVCQKKNHFQVTVHIGMAGTPKYVKTPSGPKPIESFYMKVFGVKFEAQSHLVTIEQSQSDRTKKPFLPINVSLPGDKITKVTLGRLHFSETTANNMRKKGKPNPDQRYFMLVVGLYASVEEQSILLVAHMSEKIIVRASNPGQFENDNEPLWQRGQALDTVVYQGRVGINTEAPDEALVVCGNAKIMGTVMHPSDRRAKQNIQEVDSKEQLKRIAQMRIVEYDYRPEFAIQMGIDHVHETGVIAQEVKELLPSAVKQVGDITCVDGVTIDNFLMVDKEQIFMENVGAVKQLSKLTDNLQARIQELEVWNTRLAKLKSVGSLRSNVHSKASRNDGVPLPKKPAPLPSSAEYPSKKHSHCLRHRVFQASIIMLVVTMGICVISITSLYMLTLNEDLEFPHGNSNNSVLNETTTARPTSTSTSTSVVAPTLSPGPWPPDVDFCNLLYCEEVYCCPSDPGKYSTPAPTPAPRPPTNNSQSDDTIEHLFEKLKNAEDWTNTTIQSVVIKENQHVIDQKYCVQGNCGPGNYSYVVPISKFVPVNMRMTIQMNTTELLVVLSCQTEESSDCSALMDYSDNSGYTMSNTQGYIHEWPLQVAHLYQSSYHFRTTVAGQADCSTNHNYAGVLFTDYHFHFYRRCD